MAKGRKSTPPGVRRARGEQVRTPTMPGVSKAACPAWLDQYAKSEWRRIAPALAGLGLATAIDRAALAAYCMAWSRVRHAEEMLAKEGHLLVTEHTTKAHPAIAIQMAAIREMRQICGEFGLTPSSRGRLVLPGQRSDSALAEFQDEPTLRVAT